MKITIPQNGYVIYSYLSCTKTVELIAYITMELPGSHHMVNLIRYGIKLNGNSPITFRVERGMEMPASIQGRDWEKFKNEHFDFLEQL